jgi:hypothetical protein
MKKAVVSMSLNVQLGGARPGMVEMSADFLTKAMQDQQAIFASTQRIAGGRKP